MDTMDTMVTNVFGILCIFMYHSAGWFFPCEVILKEHALRHNSGILHMFRRRLLACS
jgi:hypothetical protein